MRRTCNPGRAAARILPMALLLVLLAACTTTNRQIATLKRPDGGARVVVMPLDVELYELSAAGVTEAKADWTDAARTHLLTAFRETQARAGLALNVYDDAAFPADALDRLRQVDKLHGAVGGTILATAQPNMALPTKEKAFDWSLGPAVRPLREATGADYALFTFIRDSYSSGGRVALIILAGLVGVGVPGGAQIGFASLVDLNSGDIVWFSRLQRGVGDLRTIEAARETAEVLLADFPK